MTNRYEAFQSNEMLQSRAKNAQGRRLVDDAPGWVDELPEYFLSLTPDELCHCWVACIASAVRENEYSPADLLRCHLVVAHRLNGIKIDNPENFIMPAQPASPIKPSPIDPLARFQAVRAAAPEPRPAPAGCGFEKVSLNDAPPPKRARIEHPLFAVLMAATKEDRWLIDPTKIDKRLLKKIVSGVVKSGGPSDLNWYEAGDGRFVVGRIGGRSPGRKRKAAAARPPSA